MFLAIPMHHYVVLDLLHSFQPFHNQPYPLMTLTACTANPHDQGVVLVETPRSVEHEQVLRLLVHLELVKGVVQVDDTVCICPTLQNCVLAPVVGE